MAITRQILRPFREIACLFGLAVTLSLLSPFLLLGVKSTRGRNQIFLLFAFGWFFTLCMAVVIFPWFHLLPGGPFIFWVPLTLSYLLIGPRLRGVGDLESLRLWLPERETIQAGTRVIRLLDLRMSREHRRRLVAVTDAMLEA